MKKSESGNPRIQHRDKEQGEWHHSRWFRVQVDPASFTIDMATGSSVMRSSPSPYDIPDAIRLTYNPRMQISDIEFRYRFEGEDWTWHSLDEGDFALQAAFGSRSRRLYALRVHLKLASQHSNDEIRKAGRRLARALAGMAEAVPRPERLHNYRIAGAAFEHQRGALLHSLGELVSTD